MNIQQRVFLAQSPRSRLVAVKPIRPDLANDDDFRVRFSREVRAARKVSGIFTAPVVEADPDAPQPWLAANIKPAGALAERAARLDWDDEHVTSACNVSVPLARMRMNYSGARKVVANKKAYVARAYDLSRH